MYSLIEYTDIYLETSGNLWKYCGDVANATITDFDSFKFKTKITGRIPNYGNTKDVEIAVSLKYLSLSFLKYLNNIFGELYKYQQSTVK